MGHPTNAPLVTLGTNLDPLSVAISAADEGSNEIVVTLQVQSFGQDVTADGTAPDDTNAYELHVWLSSSSLGAYQAASTSFTVSAGTELKEITNLTDYIIATTNAGLATITVGETGTSSLYLHASLGGAIYVQELPFE